MGDAASAGPGAQVTMNCMISKSQPNGLRRANVVVDKYNDSTKKYDQTVSIDGKVVSRLSTGKLGFISTFPKHS
jgi:hypothetical protein